MTLDEFMRRARHDGVTLAKVTDLSPSTIQFLRIGKKRMGKKAAPRIFWASRGLVKPSDEGLDDSKFQLPDLSILPDPDEPGVTWEKSCVPVLLKKEREKAAAKGEAIP